MSNKHKKSSETPLWIRFICGALGVLMVIGAIVMVIPVSGSSMAYAAELSSQADQPLPTDAMISVGLHTGTEAIASFAVQSDLPTVLSYRKSESSSETLLTYPAGELTVAVDDNLYRYGTGLTTENKGIAAMGGYHIEISYFTFSELGIDDRDNPVYIEPGIAAEITDGYSRQSVSDYIELLSTVSEVDAMDQPIFPYFSANKTYIRLGSYFTKEEAENALSALEQALTLKATVVSPSENALTVLDSLTWTPVCELSTEKYMLSLASETGMQLKDSAGRIYRGSMMFDRVEESEGGLVQVVNRLPLEEYVAALLSYEVSADENSELLKAMAIILRTEAERHMQRHRADGYDVCSESHCHLFSGSSADATAIRKAVLETAGKTLTYEGKLIFTPYTTESGASTVSSADAFGKSLAYLPAIVTPWEEANNRWTVELLPYELFRILYDAGYEEIKGNIASVRILNRADGSDYVTEISFTDHLGNSVTVSGSEEIRSLFGGLLPSAQFVVGKAGDEVTFTQRTLDPDALTYSETSATLVLEGTYDSFVFSGRGVGCGVGFSIAGGRALAQMGYTCDQILAIYYPKTKIE